MLVSACIRELQTKALSLHRLETGVCDSELVNRFATIESELRSAIQAFIDRSIDDGGLTAL